uniref:Large ribosomal subunit protein uL13c n=1 Tax=Herposiphonia versicolor TaxID=2007163 RepID=A0A1Z1MFK2_9FLOR|nr:ribosomal protein L13 [Herposiphonia versicolor]ARW64830.1 ribosomal protein L13 [Herposiphonia versicolor]
MNINKTINNNKNQITNWYIIDAKNYKLGRLSSTIAHILKNKNSPCYLPNEEGKSNIIIINSKEIQITGKKYKKKEYKRHSGRPGGLKIETFEKLQQKFPNRIIEHSIKGMLPKNTLGRNLFKKIKIYSENIHPHKNIDLTEIK